MSVVDVPIDPQTALVYAEGWQSWSPTRLYRLNDVQPCAVDDNHRRMGYRSGIRSDAHAGADFVGEGLVAVLPARGQPVHVFATDDPVLMPSIAVKVHPGSLQISSEVPVTHATVDAPGVGEALREWAIGFAAGVGVPPVRQSPRVWCSWYQYFDRLTAADIEENLHHCVRHDLPVDVIQIDDGYQQAIGDWLKSAPDFAHLHQLVDGIRTHGKRAGIWLAPFLAAESSAVATEHPEWLLPDVDPGRNWHQRLGVLDTTVPAARQYLLDVFEAFVDMGIDYFKLDFLYAAAIPGPHRTSAAALAGYREMLKQIREVIGSHAYLVGCGAPTLASVGLFDAMRVSPDTAPYTQAASGDASSPGQLNAIANGRARQWQNRVFWLNDPDCLLARPQVEQRHSWADHVRGVDGLRSFSDRIESLDEWGMRTVRDYLEGRGNGGAGAPPESLDSSIHGM